MLANKVAPLQGIQPQSWIDSRVEVRTSIIHGRGIFANAPIQPGEVVIIWGGVLFTLEDIKAGKAAEHSYTALREGLFLGHTHEQGNSADDYMNHSCNPNIWMINEITWVARRMINLGDEITADFAMYWGPDGDSTMEWTCHCGSEFCRKAFTTCDWQLEELHARYGDHFAPYINERIRELRKLSEKASRKYN